MYRSNLAAKTRCRGLHAPLLGDAWVYLASGRGRWGSQEPTVAHETKFCGVCLVPRRDWLPFWGSCGFVRDGGCGSGAVLLLDWSSLRV